MKICTECSEEISIGEPCQMCIAIEAAIENHSLTEQDILDMDRTAAYILKHKITANLDQ